MGWTDRPDETALKAVFIKHGGNAVHYRYGLSQGAAFPNRSPYTSVHAMGFWQLHSRFVVLDCHSIERLI